MREHSATVIWLHGLGGDGQEWKDMVIYLTVRKMISGLPTLLFKYAVGNT